MEEYEEFCEKALARIPGASLSTESLLPTQPQSISLIRFHGMAVLSPLLNIEKRKEIQQEKQKALEVEARRQVNRKKDLLTRVQEILENVQVRKAPIASDFDLWETEAAYCNSEVKDQNVPTMFPDSLPSPAEPAPAIKLEDIARILPLDDGDQHRPNGLDTAGDPRGLASPQRCDSPHCSQADGEGLPKPSSASPQEPPFAHPPLSTREEPDPLDGGEVTPDPYILSLQNLMKKSKEYVEREQSRRSLRSSVKSSVHESLSDKENDCAKERAPSLGRHWSLLIPDKPSLDKSNVLLQGASSPAGPASLAKVDLPLQTSPPARPDSQSCFSVIPTSVPENKVIKSLTGSYAKLPSPEPSTSPKMHRRRSRPSSACHILINNPVNACELSPKGKEQAAAVMAPAAAEQAVSKSPMGLAGTCSSRVCASRNVPEASEAAAVGRPGPVCGSLENHLEDEVSLEHAPGEGELASEDRGVQKTNSTCMAAPRLHDPYDPSQSIASQSLGTACGVKSASTLEKNPCDLQMQLNKSYDVKNPSPLLMQNLKARWPLGTPAMPCGGWQLVDDSLEKVKRRLDLDVEGLQKENCPCVLAAGTAEPEGQRWLDKSSPKVPGYINKNEMLEAGTKEGEVILRRKMLAFEEMRKRLEEQHAQQLSLLIAEQEREQERLQKEIQEQEKMLKEKKAVEEMSELSNAVELEWRKIGDPSSPEAALPQGDLFHASSGSDFTNSALQYGFGSVSEAPFYLWGPPASNMTKPSVTRPFGRAQTRWSQVFNLEIQAKLNKITAVAKGFLTRRLMQTEKLKQLRQTVNDTMEFIRSFQSEAPLKRGVVSAQDASLQERVLAQLRAALYGIHDIFFVMDAAERMSILQHDREVRKEKMLRQMDKMKSPRVALSAATQKSLDRKKFMKAAEMGMPNKKFLVKQNPSETRVLQSNQGQNAPVHRLLSRQGSPKASVKGVVQSRQKPPHSRVPSRAPVPGVYAGRTQRKRPNVATI